MSFKTCIPDQQTLTLYYDNSGGGKAVTISGIAPAFPPCSGFAGGFTITAEATSNDLTFYSVDGGSTWTQFFHDGEIFIGFPPNYKTNNNYKGAFNFSDLYLKVERTVSAGATFSGITLQSWELDYTEPSNLRNYFKIENPKLQDPKGFIFDYNRLPTTDSDNGTPVNTGSFWDPTNGAVKDDINFTEVSGRLWHLDIRSNYIYGEGWFQAGHGDNQDLLFSGIKYDAGNWQPVINTGRWFDLDQQNYLYSDKAIEKIISGSGLITNLASGVENYTPITLASYHVDPWGRARVYENYNHKPIFTSISGGNETLAPTSGTDPLLYEPRISGIQWSYVNSGLYEIIYDPTVPAIARSRNIISGVYFLGSRVPWSQTHFQLPLVPLVNMEDWPELWIYEDPVYINESGIGQVNIVGSGIRGGARSVDLYLTSTFYARVSGTTELAPLGSGLYIPTRETTSELLALGFPSTNGSILIDSDRGQQVVFSYSSLNDGFFDSTAIFQNYFRPLPNSQTVRDGAKIRLVDTGISYTDDGAISNASTSGYHYAEYFVSGLPYTLDKNTGLIEFEGIEKPVQIKLESNYTRGLLLCYEPSGASNVYSPSGINVDPLYYGLNYGTLWASMFPLRARNISLKTSRGINYLTYEITSNIRPRRGGRGDLRGTTVTTLPSTSGIEEVIGPIYAGNDYLVIEATVTDRFGSAVPSVPVTLTFDAPTNIGKVDGLVPNIDDISKITNNAGVARFTYTPPDTIDGLGYYVPLTGVVNGSGLQLPEQVELNEFYDDKNGWTTLLFTVNNNDFYSDFSEFSGLFTYEADGRLELVTEVSGQDVYGQNEWRPIRPTAGVDGDGNVYVPGGGGADLASGVQYLYFPSGAIPDGETIEAYFISAKKRIRIGAVAQKGVAVAPSFTTLVDIPPFMTGEFLWGPVDDQDTTAFNSLSYLTINPFQNIDPSESRTSPRTLGNTFRIIAQNVDNKMRNKFTLGVDIGALYNTAGGRNELRKLYTLRNRFIVEVE